MYTSRYTCIDIYIYIYTYVLIYTFVCIYVTYIYIYSHIQQDHRFPTPQRHDMPRRRTRDGAPRSAAPFRGPPAPGSEPGVAWSTAPVDIGSSWLSIYIYIYIYIISWIYGK